MWACHLQDEDAKEISRLLSTDHKQATLLLEQCRIRPIAPATVDF
jgi:hypothetical protein